ncbi:tRNA (adenosine(37)-N6)-threonylcarbamoyltransferase complex ATPase subunit type 1 TsaE [Sinomicrobium pectinilyticum]|uniref:tRNA threonylcarbamoyladenosine biosynthesis protein TsaE n=1 Tax=Sinomicrobium pectinilyticum TaxID=1084421 RepID=A0A3N0E352_SINP1|nr:tRNA (adenosine(37)-N6)-threonylcarbamoyltransferase complex ATPase subunit type 1 TsaE [Sinomicrobium pectinilyticum]RNL82240.1 tRNA (adenosine(37)-N6)-threonylcarbamoyltransferase complex ATPase subunit type 1 TsaE [Sinomicrobium pectinilyticum]
MKKISYTLEEIEVVSRQLLDEVPGKTLLFYGDMGVGKTTLIKSLAHHLGVKDVTGSPTFGLVNEYEGEHRSKIYHFDFYRINDEIEALDIGIEDYLYTGAWVFIEWPEKIEGLLPEDAVAVRIEKSADGRRELSF